MLTDLQHLQNQGGQGPRRGSDPDLRLRRPRSQPSTRASLLVARRRRRSRRKTRRRRRNVARSVRRRRALIAIRGRSGVVDDAVKVEDVAITVRRSGVTAAGFHRPLLCPRVPRTMAAVQTTAAMDPDRNIERLAQKRSLC